MSNELKTDHPQFVEVIKQMHVVSDAFDKLLSKPENKNLSAIDLINMIIAGNIRNEKEGQQQKVDLNAIKLNSEQFDKAFPWSWELDGASKNLVNRISVALKNVDNQNSTQSNESNQNTQWSILLLAVALVANGVSKLKK